MSFMRHTVTFPVSYKNVPKCQKLYPILDQNNLYNGACTRVARLARSLTANQNDLGSNPVDRDVKPLV